MIAVRSRIAAVAFASFVVGAGLGWLARITVFDPIAPGLAVYLLSGLAASVGSARRRRDTAVVFAATTLGLAIPVFDNDNVVQNIGLIVVFAVFGFVPAIAGALAGMAIDTWRRPLDSKPIPLWVLVTPAVVVLAAAALFATDLKRYPAPMIRERLLAEHYGATGADVAAALERRGWAVVGINPPAGPGDNLSRLKALTSAAQVQTDPGEYRVLFAISVRVTWVFDANGRLLNVHVTKEVDGP